MGTRTLLNAFESMPVSRRVWWSGLALIAAFAAFAIWAAVEARDKETENWKRQMGSLTLVLSEEFSESLIQVSEALNEIVRHAERHAALGEKIYRAQMSSMKAHLVLKDAIARLSLADVATYVASNGDNTNFSRRYPVSGINLADRDYFVHHRANPGNAEFISQPVRNKGNGRWTFYMSRRINGPQGEFLGLALVGVSLDRLLEMHAKVVADLGRHSSISVFKTEGDLQLLSRWPFDENLMGKINKAGSAYQILKVQKRDEGYILTNAPRFSTGHRELRLGTLRPVRGYPLHVLTVVTEDTYLAAWHASIGWWGGITFVATLCMLGGLFALVKTLKRGESSLAEMKRLRAEALQASAAKSSFLAVMSHEIRTPMNGILGMAQMLELPGVDDKERRQYARTIMSSGRTLMTLLNDILDYSKLEAGKLSLSVSPTSIEAVLSDSVKLFESMATAKGLKIQGQWQGQPGAWYIMDSIRIRQMLTNLISNAVKYSDKGLIQVLVYEAERYARGERLLRFEVKDEGDGISKAEQQQLFKPFSQVGRTHAGQHEGTGLGLSTVMSLAQSMDGTAGVQSDVGKGSTFWFTVVVEASHEEDGLDPVVSSPASVASIPATHVLVIEDDSTTQMLLASMLGKWGYEAHATADVQELAARCMGEGRCDAVVMDLMLVGAQGLHTVKQMREWEASQMASRLPVIALTSASDPDLAHMCQQSGVDAVMAKPLDTRQLRLTLSDLLERRSTLHTTAGGSSVP